MQGKYWLVVVSALVFAACEWKQPNPYRCPDGEFCPPVGGPCSGDQECRAPTPVCKEDANVCVECLENTDCAATRPVCTAQNTCVQCEKHTDCNDSGLCLAGGSCADRSDVTYVGGPAASANRICSMDVPCQSLVQALDPMVPVRKYIRITGAIVNDGVAQIENRRVDIYGVDGAKISRVQKDEVLIIKGTSVVTLTDLEILGGAGASDKDCVEISETADVTMTRVDQHNHGFVGITMTGGKLVMIESRVHDNSLDGVKVTAGTLEIRRSLIYLNRGTAGVLATGASTVTIDSSILTRNTGTNGGVSIASTAPVVIRNSIIARNGDSATLIGGVTLNSNNAVFEFNTVADNLSNAVMPPYLGMSCLNPINVSSNIFTGNLINGCNATYSLADTTLPGDGNKPGDPRFGNRDASDPASPTFFSTFYRIMPGSAAIDSANPAATLDVDIDGDPRPMMGKDKDMGADELKMP